jgi:UDP-N-acetyl-2-amino-2-deoxyglucuronate dehydrogenase
VVGARRIGSVHARAIRSLPEVAELRLVVSTREATARRLAEAQGATGWSTDHQAALADPEIDAVSICTPSGTHADLAVAALQSGKHVMVEKPIDVSLEAADRILAAERASGRSPSCPSTASTPPPSRSSRPSRPATWDG